MFSKDIQSTYPALETNKISGNIWLAFDLLKVQKPINIGFRQQAWYSQMLKP